MGLLNPLLLGLGAAAAVPLLLHLLQRHHGPRVPFPALRYLRRAEKESARRIRARQLLLMLLRVAAVLLIALAAARPFVRSDAVGHSPTAAVIILDNSMSSAAVEAERRVLDELRERALEMIAGAGPDDRFWLLRAGSPAEPALAGDAAATAMRIRETEPTAAGADLGAALRQAAAILATGADGRAAEIHLLTDLQAASLPGPAAAEPGAPPIIVWHPGTAAPENRAVAAVEIGGGTSPVAGTGTTVAAYIAGDGVAPVSVRMSIDGALTAAASAAPGAAALLTLPPQQPGILTGSVELDEDALRLDDRRYFVVHVQPPPAVALTGDVPFVSDALDVLASGGRVQRAAASDAEILIHAADGAVPAGVPTVVVLPPASPVALTAANQRLAAAGIPWRFQPPSAGEARFAQTPDDPLLNTLERVRLRVVYPLVADGSAADDTVLLRLAGGEAWAVRGTRRVGGTYVLLASPLSPDASTLPVSAAMLPLLDRLTGAWAAAQPPRTDVRPGEEIALPAGSTAVIRPDGSIDDVGAARTYRFGDEPGIHRVTAGDELVAAFAVNPETAPLDRLDTRALAGRLPGWTVHATTSAGAWQRAVFRERLGREIWRPLLVALLLVLLIETLVAAAGRARRAPVQAAPEIETG